jgi:DNA (cytosine-5)-methyltransferase 1
MTDNEQPFTFGSLFAGIGGFDLGFQRAGLQCKFQVEIDEFCLKVLEKHWPEVRRFKDVRQFCRRVYDCEPENEEGEVICQICRVEFGECDCIGTDQLLDEIGSIDVLVGGFPCQDCSVAGKREGLAGERSGLWSEMLRVTRELCPSCVVIENVGGLARNGLERVLCDLHQIGYDAEWSVLSAASFGAAHRRSRLFVLAYPAGNGLEGWITTEASGEVTVASLDHLHDWPQLSAPLGIRSTHGVSHFVDRIRSLGNSVVPQIAEWIGRRIIGKLKEFRSGTHSLDDPRRHETGSGD